MGKTTKAFNLGIGLARRGKKVLVVDLDAQGNLTSCMGVSETDSLEHTAASVMSALMQENSIRPDFAIMEHGENIYFVPANIELSGVEAVLVNTTARESVLKEYISIVSLYFDFILLDTMPSLGMLTINALTAADSVLILVQTQYLSLKGLG